VGCRREKWEQGGNKEVPGISVKQRAAMWQIEQPAPTAEARAPWSAGEWRTEIDPPMGKTYYWNTETREVTWNKPDGI